MKPNLSQKNIVIQKKQFLSLIFYILLPNFIFLLFAFFTHTSRPLINADYLIPLLFLVLPFKYSKILGVILLSVVIFLDTLMMIVQVFPFLDIDGIIYLLPFIFNAPSIYKLGILLLFVTIIILIYISLKLTYNINMILAFVITLLTLALTYCNTILNIKYYNNLTTFMVLARDNYYIIHSQSLLLEKFFNSAFRQLTISKDRKPKFINLPEEQKNAANGLKQNSSKILFITAESLGYLKNDSQNNEVLKNLINQKDKFEFFNVSSFFFQGITVAGELRELCNFKLVSGGYNFKNNSPEEFKDCLPNKLQKEGFNTIALHGASSRLYERYTLYEKLGFKESYFFEHFLDKKKCNPFSGVCDSELFEFIADKFKTQKKLFFYWMTLTAHLPYHQKDIFNHRFECSKFGITPNTEICRNIKLQTQFFDQLAELVQKEEMKGVEVMIVGDHIPPFVASRGVFDIFRFDEVAVIHFKIKE